MYNKKYPIEVDTPMKYCEFVQKVCQVLTDGVKGVNFTSVELYSEIGYPLAPTPNIYLEPLSNWGLRDNELIYAYPKKLFNNYLCESDIDCEKLVINIQLKDSDIKKELKFDKNHNLYLYLGIQLSMDMHIPIDYIKIYYSNPTNQHIALNNMDVSKKSIDKRNLSFTISNTYSNNEPFSVFQTVYTSCYPSNFIPDFHTFNAYLLFLVREYGEDRDKYRLLSRLGLLRKISCSPPLVYSLYLLFTQSPTSLPHRIAINEGIITTISLLSTTSDSPTISKFPQLWMHIEKYALTPDLQLTEIYETTFISKRTRENPRDDDTRRLLQEFPHNQYTIVTWRNVSSTHDAFCYIPLTRLEDFTEGVKHRFPLQHPVQLYKSFVEERKSYGLMLPLIRGLSSPYVFLGRTEGRYGYFNYFSPEDGKCYSYNPHDINISKRLEVSNINSYPKIIIILDISSGMHSTFIEYSETSDRPNPELKKIDAAIMLIETLIDSLIGIQSKSLLGAIVISNNHEFMLGFKEVIRPTFEYGIVLKKIKAYTYISKFSPQNFQINTEIILNALEYCTEEYLSSNRELITEIFLFTNGETSLKYGNDHSSIENKISELNLVVNTVIMSKHGHQLQILSQITKGVHINDELMAKLASNEIKFLTPIPHPICDYSAILQDILSGNMIHEKSGSYQSISKELMNNLSTAEELIQSTGDQKSKILGINLFILQILNKVTAYIKSPNPYCRLYPFKNEILKWIIFMQGPIHSPFEGSIFILELYFGEQYPHYPPKLRFLSSVYHPNVDKAGHICHPILIEDYSPSVSLRQILDAIHSMLAQPIVSHAVRSKVLEIAIWYNELYVQTVNSLSTILNLKGKTLLTIEEDFKIKSDYSNVSHPPALVCFITNQLFDNPVMTPEGNTYERQAILQHIENTHTDPISHTPLRSSDLIPNHAIADAVLKYKKKPNAKTNWWMN